MQASFQSTLYADKGTLFELAFRAFFASVKQVCCEAKIFLPFPPFAAERRAERALKP